MQDVGREQAIIISVSLRNPSGPKNPPFPVRGTHASAEAFALMFGSRAPAGKIEPLGRRKGEPYIFRGGQGEVGESAVFRLW
jgi:hypothetical protein